MEQRGDGSPFSDVLIGNYKIFLMTLQVFPEMFGQFSRRSPDGISFFGQRCPERRNVSYLLEAVPIGDGMQIGEKKFLSGKEETRRNPDGFQAFLTQPDEKFFVKIRAGAYWYSFLYFEIRNDAVMNTFYNVPRLRLCPVDSFGRIHPSIPSRCRIVRRARIYAYVRRKKVSCYMQAPAHVICCRHQQYAFYFIKPQCALQFQKGT